MKQITAAAPKILLGHATWNDYGKERHEKMLRIIQRRTPLPNAALFRRLLH